jgi:hypothetical protein
MTPELVVTPGGYRQRDRVYKIGADLRLRILTERLQGIDASGTPVADYGSIPRDGGNPALTPGYTLPPGPDTEEGDEPEPPFGRGWIAFAHWTNEGTQPISSLRATWRVPPEPETRSGQTIFLFMAMQDPIPMTLLPALQWGTSAAGGGDYWSVASWYVGGTTGAVFHGELVRVDVGDELNGVISLVSRQRAHCDYRCGFEGIAEADLPVHRVRELSRCGEILAAYGVKQCTDYPAANATGFRNIELVTGSFRPPLAWNPVNAATECGQHIVVLSDANPGGEVDVHFRPISEAPAIEPAITILEETPAEAAPVPEEVVGAAELSPEEVAAAPEVIAEQEPVMAEAFLEEAAPFEETAPFLETPVEGEAADEEAAPEAVEVELLITAAREPEAAVMPEPEPAVTAAREVAPIQEQATETPPAIPSLEVHPRIDRLVEITIHNHSPAGATSSVLEARVASLEATLAALTQVIASQVQPQSSMSVNGDLASRLERLVQLKGTGLLDDDEFAAVKAQLIGGRAEDSGSSIDSETVPR